jgi:hypothetical protein
MRTVHFNRRALALALLIGTGIVVLTISHVSSTLSQTSSTKAPLGRDALARRRVEDQHAEEPKKPADSVDHQDADVAAEKHEDFIDDPRKPPENDPHKSGKYKVAKNYSMNKF